MKLHSQGKFLKKGIVFTAIASMLMITACSANGSEPKYPTKSIEGIVPFGAGGGTDLVSRAIATVAEKKLGQGIAITNKPGATATVGTQYVYDKKGGRLHLAVLSGKSRHLRRAAAFGAGVS